MAAANPAENLRKEASCAICLDYFTDPVTIDCGHNFCRSCISGSWEGTGTDFPCPQCREWSRHRSSIRPNRQLANVIETARKLSQGSAGRKKCNVCEKHEEKLKLFCREDQRVICVVCKRSRDHASHTVIPVKKAAQRYKQKIEKCLRPLRKDLEYLLQFKSEEEKKAEELRSGTEIMRQKIVSDFEDLYQFLNKKKQSLLSKLEEEEKKALRKIRENVMRVEEQSSSLMQFISETEEKCQQKAIRLLKDIKGILSRCQKRRIPKPVVVSTEVKTCFSLSYRHELNKMFTKSGEYRMEGDRYPVQQMCEQIDIEHAYSSKNQFTEHGIKRKSQEIDSEEPSDEPSTFYKKLKGILIKGLLEIAYASNNTKRKGTARDSLVESELTDIDALEKEREETIHDSDLESVSDVYEILYRNRTGKIFRACEQGSWPGGHFNGVI